MQAIITRYHGPTDRKPSRIGAHCNGGRLHVPYDHALTPEGNHLLAAKTLCRSLNWGGELIGGATPAGDGYAFVFNSELSVRG